MKALAATLMVVAVAFMVVGCVMPATVPVAGGLITSNVKGPVTGVDNSVGMTKTGTSQAVGIVFFAQGDASIKAAMEAGGITKVHHVDNETFSVLGVYTTCKTIVYGE